MDLIAGMAPYPSWLNPGDNAWQLISATLVGLMSLPGIAVLYGGLLQTKWVVNTMLMAFSGFALVLVVWVLWGYNLAFGPQSHFGSDGSFLSGFVGKFWPMGSHFGEQNQAVVRGAAERPRVPLPDVDVRVLPGRLRRDHAAAVPGRDASGAIKFKAWLLLVPLWITFVYCINAVAALGRRLARPEGRGRLLGRLRHPPRRPA